MAFRIFIIVLIFSGIIHGQVNTEKKRPDMKESGLSGNVKLTYTVVSGNSELTRIGISPGFTWYSGKSQVFMLNDLSRVSSKSGAIINKGFSHFRYNYEVIKRYIGELFLQAQYNRSRDLDQRYLAGVGIRIVVSKNNPLIMAVGITGMYEYEKLISGKITKIFRGSYYITLRSKSKSPVALVNTIYIQPAVSSPDDIRILNEGELTVNISSRLALVNSIYYRYDNQPPPGIKNFDLEFTNGVKFIF